MTSCVSTWRAAPWSLVSVRFDTTKEEETAVPSNTRSSGRRTHSLPRLATVGLTAVLLLQGCVWVRLSDDGASVRQASADEVRNCQQVGQVHAHTLNRILFQRSRAKVQEELIVLASNEAAAMNGNRLVAEAPAANGEQRFRVYRCPS
jgi:hypothetical protein